MDLGLCGGWCELCMNLVAATCLLCDMCVFQGLLYGVEGNSLLGKSMNCLMFLEVLWVFVCNAWMLSLFLRHGFWREFMILC